MKYKLAVALFLAAQPVHAAPCHHYARWYYPYPQSCRNSRYTAEFKFMNKIKFNNVKPASLPTAPTVVPPLQWTKYSSFPTIDVPQNIVCTDQMSEAQHAFCLLKIEMEKRREGTTDQR
jgi:hypothetical protein